MSQSTSGGPAGLCTWRDAVRISALRTQRNNEALDTSVRALGLAFGCSHGRASDLVRIYGAFGRRELTLLGFGDRGEAEALLSRLTYRQFRKLLMIKAWMTMTRVAAVRDMLDRDPRTAEYPSSRLRS